MNWLKKIFLSKEGYLFFGPMPNTSKYRTSKDATTNESYYLVACIFFDYITNTNTFEKTKFSCVYFLNTWN